MQLDKNYIQELIENKINEAEKLFGKTFKNTLIEIIGLEKMLHPDHKDTERKSRLIPLAEWNNYHNFPTVPALRQYKFHSRTNGFEEVIEYGGENGNRILINEDKFFIWHQNKSNAKKSKQA